MNAVSRFSLLPAKSCLVTHGALLTLLFLHVPNTACRAQLIENAQKCEQNVNSNPDLALQGCTALLDSKQLPGEEVVKVLNIRGLAYSNKGKYDLAIQDFDKAIALKPDAPEAFNNRGVTYERKGDFDRAIEDYDEAIRLKPDYASPFNNRAAIYLERKGDHDRAIQDLDQAIRLRPDYAEAISNRGHAYYAKGDPDRAIQDYNSAIELEPNYTGNLFDRASAYCSKKEYGRALQDLDRALQINPKDPTLLWARGIAHLLLGQFQAAKDDLSLSLHLRPEDPYCAIWLYLASSKNGQDAKDELRQHSAALKSTAWPAPAIRMYLGSLSGQELLAAAKDPDARKSSIQSCQAHFYLGEGALLRGKLAEAKRLFQRSAAVGSTASFEYMGAVAELDRLQVTQQSPKPILNP